MRLLSTALVATLLLGCWAAAGAGEKDKPAARDRILELMDTVRNGLTEEKVTALDELGSITDEGRLDKFGVPPFLVGVIKSGDYVPRVRAAAVKALTGVMKFVPNSKDTALQVLTFALADAKEQTAVRQAIAEAMGGMLNAEAAGDRTSFNVLVAIVRERKDDAAVVCAALVAFGRTGYREAINLVVAAVSDPNPEIREAAIKALEAMFNSSRPGAVNMDTINILVRMASDDKLPLEVRESAMRTLVAAMKAGVARPTEVAPALVSILEKAGDARLAEAVVKVLTLVPEDISVEALRKAYETFQKPPAAGQDYADVRAAIARALGEYLHPLARKGQVPSGQSAAALLIRICSKDPNPKVVTAAAYSLSNLCDARYDRREAARELIETLASDSDRTVVQTVRETLKWVTGREIARGEKDPKEAAREWKKWYEANKDSLAPRN